MGKEAMTCFDLLNREIAAVALGVLGVTLGVCLTHLSLTTDALPAPAEAASDPIATPLPILAAATINVSASEVPAEVEVAASAPVVAAPTPAVNSIEPKPEPLSTCWPGRRGLFRRR